MIELYTNKQNCCGCTACMNICPTQAIIMKPDEEGFLYPTVDESKCIKCGLCHKVCAFQNGYDTIQNYEKPFVYAVKNVSEEVRNKSTSGGMFTTLADEILSRNGVIYGVGFDEDMVVSHQRATDKTKLNLFRGSKYVQSKMAQILKNIENDLKEEKIVLFTGTSCQVAGVREYLNKKEIRTDNLVLCDIVCHGVPSPLIFAEYLKFCEKKRGKKVKNHIFRSKINGWHKHTEVNIFEDGEIDYSSHYSQLFKFIFYSHVVLRPSCHNCKYTNLNRPSDITIADFWDIDKSNSDFDDNKGVSLVLLNTKKGSNIFEAIKDQTIYINKSIDECLQPNLKEPTKPSPLRNLFWNDYYNNGFEFVMKKYYGCGLKGNMKRMIVTILKKLNLYSHIKDNRFINSFRTRTR